MDVVTMKKQLKKQQFSSEKLAYYLVPQLIVVLSFCRSRLCFCRLGWFC